jgi:hypothetical protein
MTRAKVGFALLAFLLPLLLNATHFIKNDLLNDKASKLIEDMGDELYEKTDFNTYAIVTNEAFPEKFNLVEYVKKQESKLGKPYVVLIFAPNAVITATAEQSGRVGLVPSSKDVGALYDSVVVKDYAIAVVASKDGNSDQDKYNIGVVQSYSELADQLAQSKGIKLTKTLPNETHTVVGILEIIVLIGSLFVVWIYYIRPILEKRKNGI